MYLLCSRFTRYNHISKPSLLENNVLETTASFLATGLDPDRSIIFNQSSVSGHAELAWILNCVSRIGWLNRMTQFKDKAGSDKKKLALDYIFILILWQQIYFYIKLPTYQ